jgi:hypothetical protein
MNEPVLLQPEFANKRFSGGGSQMRAYEPHNYLRAFCGLVDALSGLQEHEILFRFQLNISDIKSDPFSFLCLHSSTIASEN